MRTPVGLLARLGGLGPGVMSESLVVRAGTREDYRHLSSLHYRAGEPATMDRVLCLVDPRDGMAGTDPRRLPPVAVLVASFPTLNGRWRRIAWPGRYDGPDRCGNAARLNRELRTISRVIVDPRWRGLGVGTRLVRVYLAEHATRHTEALATMGHACSFFESAGMRRVAVPPAARDCRLGALLEARRTSAVDPVRALVHAARADRSVEHALRRWANDARSTRSLRSASLPVLAAAALRQVTLSPVVHVASRSDPRAIRGRSRP